LFCTIAALLLACTAGCQTWRPSLEQVTTQPAEPGFLLDDYLRAMRSGEWTYLRCTSPCRQESDKGEYGRVQNDRRMTEGRLLGAEFQPIERYIDPSRTATARPSSDETLKKLKGAGFVYFKLDHPLEAIPRTLTWGEPDEASSRITYYDYRGRSQATGTLTRTAELEGFETVTCPAGTFESCLRVRVDLEVRFPWVFHMTWTSYLWISREAGEVRRLHHLSGWFLIFWFNSGHEYELQQVRPGVDNEEAPAVLSPRWSTGAILFDRIAPRPVIGGMIVDFDEGSAPAADTQAAE
jgi:hypothetical protein